MLSIKKNIVLLCLVGGATIPHWLVNEGIGDTLHNYEHDNAFLQYSLQYLTAILSPVCTRLQKRRIRLITLPRKTLLRYKT